MDHKPNDSTRTLAITASMFIHAAFVCAAAFLPIYLTSQQANENLNEIGMPIAAEGIAPETGSATPIESTTPAQDEISQAEPAPTQAAPKAKAEVFVTQSVSKPAKPVEAIKEVPKKKPANSPPPKRVMMAKEKPAETLEDSQAVIEVSDKLNEDGVNSIDDSKSSEVEVAKENAIIKKSEIKSEDLSIEEAAEAKAVPVAVAAASPDSQESVPSASTEAEEPGL